MISKATKLETEKRIFTIQGWIIDSVADYLIIKNCDAQWGIGSKQAGRLLKKAYALWASEAINLDDKRVLRIAELKQLVRSMKEVHKGTPQGITAINQVQKEISKLESLYPAHRHVVEGSTDKPVQHKVEIKVINTGYKIANSEEEIDV